MIAKKLAGYYRLSQEDVDMKSNALKDESNSIHSQRLLCQRFLSENSDLSHLQFEEFIDDGFSGTNFERPEFQRMMNLVKSGEIQCIIVKDLSRFGRDYLQVGDYLEHILPFLGVRFISINDHYDSNRYLGTTGGIDIAFRNLIYQKYSQDLSEKVKSAMHLKMSKGAYVTHCPYGYMKKPGIKHQMFPDPETAPIVREIFLSVINGKKSTEIAAELNRRKVPTPMQHKRLSRKGQENAVMWSHQAVLRIIKEYKYTGAMVNFRCENREIRAKVQSKIPQDKWVIVENQHEAIVTHEEYEAANQQISTPKRGTVTRTDQRDRIYYCGHCGRKLRKTFGLDEYFSCPTKLYVHDCECKDIFWSKSDLENILLEVYRKQLYALKEEINLPTADRPQDSLTEYLKLAKQISKQIDDCNSDRIQQYEAYREGKIGKDVFLEQKHAALKRKEQLEAQLEEIENEMQKTKSSQKEGDERQKQIQRVVQVLDKSEVELKNDMLNAVDRVILYSNNQMEIRWKEKDIFQNLSIQSS